MKPRRVNSHSSTVWCSFFVDSLLSTTIASSDSLTRTHAHARRHTHTAYACIVRARCCHSFVCLHAHKRWCVCCLLGRRFIFVCLFAGSSFGFCFVSSLLCYVVMLRMCVVLCMYVISSNHAAAASASLSLYIRAVCFWATKSAETVQCIEQA